MTPAIELRSQQIRLSDQQQQSTISPSLPQETTVSSTVSPRSRIHSASGRYAIAGSHLLESQREVTISQLARQTLGTVGKELQLMKRGLTQSFSTNSSFAEVSVKVAGHKQKIEQTLNAARVDGNRVLDADLNVKYHGSPERTFTIPGLDFNRHRQQSESLRLEFPGKGSAVVQFSPDKDDKSVVRQMDRALVPFGIRVKSDAKGQILFSMGDGDYHQMQEQVLVTGQGHRYPAGQPNVITTKPEPEGVEDFNPSIKDRDGVRQALAKVHVHLRKVQQGIDEIKQFHSELEEAQPSEISGNSQTTIDHKLAAVTSLSDFTSTYQALSAQANVHRHTVVALLS